MDDRATISDAEWEVMKVLWANGSATSDQIVRALEPKVAWKPKTILTLINRLMKKGVVGHEKQGRAYRYFPRVDEEACVRAEGRSFLQRVYDGAMKPMLVNFLKDARLSKEDIEDLKRLLNERDKHDSNS